MYKTFIKSLKLTKSWITKTGSQKWALLYGFSKKCQKDGHLVGARGGQKKAVFLLFFYIFFTTFFYKNL